MSRQQVDSRGCEVGCCGSDSNSAGTSEPPGVEGSWPAVGQRGSRETSSPPWEGWSCTEGGKFNSTSCSEPKPLWQWWRFPGLKYKLVVNYGQTSDTEDFNLQRHRGLDHGWHTWGLCTCCCEPRVRSHTSVHRNTRCRPRCPWARTPPDGRSCLDGTGRVWLHRDPPPQHRSPPPASTWSWQRDTAELWEHDPNLCVLIGPAPISQNRDTDPARQRTAGERDSSWAETMGQRSEWGSLKKTS